MHLQIYAARGAAEALDAQHTQLYIVDESKPLLFTYGSPPPRAHFIPLLPSYIPLAYLIFSRAGTVEI